MSYPVKYRERALEYREEGHTLEETSRVFKAAISTIRKWEKQRKETGTLTPKVPQRPFKKIDPVKLRAYVDQRRIPERNCSGISLRPVSHPKSFEASEDHTKKRPGITRNRTTTKSRHTDTK